MADQVLYLVEWSTGPERGATVVRAPHALKAETTFLNASDADGYTGRRCTRTSRYFGSSAPEYEASAFNKAADAISESTEA